MASATLLNPPASAAANGPSPGTAEAVRLTTYLAIFIAALYIRGEERETGGHLQGRLRPLIASDASVLRQAEEYVRVCSFDSFLSQLPALLDTDARLCLLLNVCDGLLADAPWSPARDARFSQLLATLGQSKVRFQPYVDALIVKNSPSNLGSFDAAPAADRLTPPMALVVGLVHMRSAGSGMGQADTGLDACFGASQALLDAASLYANRVRLPQFLASAAGVLDERQRLGVLLNVCDLMMRVRVTDSQRSLFRRMRSALGFEGRTFEPYLNLVLLKNDIPHEGEKRSPEAAVFDRKYQWSEEGAQDTAGGSAKQAGAQTVAGRTGPSISIDERIARVREKTRQLSSALKGEDAGGNGSAEVADPASAVPASPDGDGPAHLRAYRDAEGSGQGAASFAATANAAASALRSDARPGDRRALADATMSGSVKHLIDDRSAFESERREPAAGPHLDRRVTRRDAVADRTRTLSSHIAAMLSARSLAEACRIPALPEWVPDPQSVSRAHRQEADNDAQVSNGDPIAAALADAGTMNTGAREADDPTDRAAAEQPTEKNGAEAAQDDSEPFALLAADQGGPFVNLDTPPASREAIALNRTLRRLGVFLLPALLLIYGTTVVCEMLSGQAFIESGNLATDARIGHRMASLQHNLHLLAPDPGGIVATAAVFGAGEGEPSDHEKASRFLEQRKEELATLSRRHESASSLAAERQHWFATAKSIVLLGLGMALWGMLFRSKRMLHVSTATGIASMLVCANGYWLWLRF